MSLDEVASNINNQLCRENERICQLQEKLLTYNDDINEKTDLQMRVSDLQQLIENLENNLKKNNADQMSMIDVQKKKLKKSEDEEAAMLAANNKLIGLNDRMVIQICSLKEKEKILICEIKRSEEHKVVLEDELCKTKETVDEQGRAVDRLKIRVKCIGEELCCTTGLVEQRHAEQRRLSEAYCKQESELKRAACELGDAKSRAERADEQLACEKHDLCCELEAKRAALRDVTERLAEVKQTADRERARVRRLDESAAEQRHANEQHKRDADAQAQRLNRENRGKEVSVCRMMEQTAELQRDGDRMAADMRAVKEQVRADECLLETAKRAAAAAMASGGGGGGCEQQLERDMDALACDVRRKTKKIAELERQVCCLRGEWGAVKNDVRTACGCPPPPPPCCPQPKPPCCPPPKPPCCPQPKPPCCPQPKPPCCPPPKRPCSPQPKPPRSPQPKPPRSLQPKPPCSPQPKPPRSPQPKPPRSLPPAESCSSTELLAPLSVDSRDPNSTYSSDSINGSGSGSEDVFFTELKQLYCDVEKIRKNNGLCTDT